MLCTPGVRTLRRLAPYLAFGRAAFQRQLAYRAANWAGLFTNLFFLLLRAHALMALYAHREQIGGLTVERVVTYVTVTQSLLTVCPQWGRLGLAGSVRTGQVAVQLLRPVDLVAVYLSRRMGISVYQVGARMLPVLLLGGLWGLLDPPAAGRLGPFVASVALGAWIAAALQILVESSSFWLESERGVRYLVLGAALLPSGLLLPVDFYPDWAQALFLLTPFPYTLYVPAELWMTEGTPWLERLLAQGAWGLLLTLLARLAVLRGGQRLQVLGG